MSTYKKYIYNIIDNKTEILDLSIYVISYFENKNYFYTTINILIDALKINKSINTIIFDFGEYYFEALNILIDKISTIINSKNNITALIIQHTFKECNFNPLFNALQSNKYIKTLNISNNEINQFIDNIYIDTLEHYNSLKSYIINRLRVPNLTNINQTLDTLQNQLNEVKQYYINKCPFYNMLINNKSINTLILSNNKINNKYLYNKFKDYEIFLNIIQQNKTIKNLDITGCNYYLCNDDILLKFIENNIYLETLIISANKEHISTDTLDKIKSCIKNNKYLKEVIIKLFKDNTIQDNEYTYYKDEGIRIYNNIISIKNI